MLLQLLHFLKGLILQQYGIMLAVICGSTGIAPDIGGVLGQMVAYPVKQACVLTGRVNHQQIGIALRILIQSVGTVVQGGYSPSGCAHLVKISEPVDFAEA